MRWVKRLGIAFGAFLLLCVLFTTYLHWHKPKKLEASKKLENKIAAHLVEDPEWNVTLAPEKIRQINDIFSQHFYYLGHGKQCIAFVSYDGQYVVKFLLQKPLTVKSQFQKLPNYFPFTLLKNYKGKRILKRKDELFKAFMLSYHVAPEQTGILYVHLNPTSNIFHKPLIIDVDENPVVIDPDVTQFVIQKRAHHVKPTIIDLMRSGRVIQAKARVDQVLMLLFDAAKKGVMDADTGLVRNNNIGFLDTRAIYVDTGKLRLVKGACSKEDFIKDLKRLQPLYKWLQIYYPELADHYAEKKEQLIDSY